MKASFFQILINPLKLRLCRNFARKYREILPENAELRICSGETWDVELTQIDGDHYFAAGWSKFAGDLELRPTDFLVFTFGGGSTFDVSVYGNDCCEKKPLYHDSCSSDQQAFDFFSHKKNKKSRIRDDDNSDNPRIEIVLKKHQNSRVTIRKHFAEAAGIINKKKVAMEYVGGYRNDVVLDLRTKKCSFFRLDLTAGWPEFRKLNRLSVGVTYLFEFIPSKQVIQVKPISKKIKKEMNI
ncbi:hypothetical protein ABFX02_08G043400 [Erythranthe guttata]